MVKESHHMEDYHVFQSHSTNRSFLVCASEVIGICTFPTSALFLFKLLPARFVHAHMCVYACVAHSLRVRGTVQLFEKAVYTPALGLSGEGFLVVGLIKETEMFASESSESMESPTTERPTVSDPPPLPLSTFEGGGKLPQKRKQYDQPPSALRARARFDCRAAVEGLPSDPSSSSSAAPAASGWREPSPLIPGGDKFINELWKKTKRSVTWGVKMIPAERFHGTSNPQDSVAATESLPVAAGDVEELPPRQTSYMTRKIFRINAQSAKHQ